MLGEPIKSYSSAFSAAVIFFVHQKVTHKYSHTHTHTEQEITIMSRFNSYFYITQVHFVHYDDKYFALALFHAYLFLFLLFHMQLYFICMLITCNHVICQKWPMVGFNKIVLFYSMTVLCLWKLISLMTVENWKLWGTLNGNDDYYFLFYSILYIFVQCILKMADSPAGVPSPDTEASGKKSSKLYYKTTYKKMHLSDFLWLMLSSTSIFCL